MTAMYCWPCAKNRPRIAAPDRKQNANLKPLKLGGKWCCVDCEHPVSHAPGTRPPLRCGYCQRSRQAAICALRYPAQTAVNKAIAAGAMPKAATLVCVDCGRPAQHYDHRDYTKPLDVVPVCRSCNVIRGHAFVPDPDTWVPRSLELHRLDALAALSARVHAAAPLPHRPLTPAPRPQEAA